MITLLILFGLFVALLAIVVVFGGGILLVGGDIVLGLWIIVTLVKALFFH